MGYTYIHVWVDTTGKYGVLHFQDICNTFDEGSCTRELPRLKLFPFSLKDRAKHWLINLPPNSIGYWQELQKQFYKEFFPMHKTQAIIKEIQNFSQGKNESFAQCWTRFKDLLRRCPHHSFDKFHQVSICYSGLNPDTKKTHWDHMHREFSSFKGRGNRSSSWVIFETSRGWDLSSNID